MRKYSALFILLSILTLASCRTMEEVSYDLNSAKDSGLHMISKNINKDNMSTNCPQVKIVDSLGHLNDFADNTKPSAKTLMSQVKLSIVESGCIHNQKSVTANVKIAFESILGPKAKASKHDKPFLAYPFFVAITEPNGKVMAKEVFAASMSYTASETNHIYYETLRPIIPISQQSKTGEYSILVGFQLDDEQLKYNRTMNKPNETQKVKAVHE